MLKEHSDIKQDVEALAPHDEVADDQARLGQAFFLGVFYVCLILEAGGSIVGFGYAGLDTTRTYGDVVLWAVALVGLLSLFVICALASRLHDGDPSALRYSKGVGSTFLFAAGMVGILGEGSAWALILALQLSLPGLFALLANVHPSRAFLAARRGAPLDSSAEVIQEESILVKSGESFALREEARPAVATQVKTIHVARIVLASCAAAGLLLAFLSRQSLWLAFLLGVTGLVAMPLYLVLSNLADNWTFLDTTKGFEKAHLRHVTRDLLVLRTCLVGAIVVLSALALIDLAMR